MGGRYREQIRSLTPRGIRRSCRTGAEYAVRLRELPEGVCADNRCLQARELDAWDGSGGLIVSFYRAASGESERAYVKVRDKRDRTMRSIWRRMCAGMNKKPLSRPQGRDFFLENGQKSIDRTVGL